MERLDRVIASGCLGTLLGQRDQLFSERTELTRLRHGRLDLLVREQASCQVPLERQKVGRGSVQFPARMSMSHVYSSLSIADDCVATRAAPQRLAVGFACGNLHSQIQIVPLELLFYFLQRGFAKVANLQQRIFVTLHQLTYDR